MAAVLPLGHVYDEIAGPFYDTAGLTRWLRKSRQALHQKVARHTVLACSLADSGTSIPHGSSCLTGPIPALTDVLTALSAGTDDNWMIALWLQAPSEQLGGEPPSAWLRKGGDPTAVLALARTVADRWAR